MYLLSAPAAGGDRCGEGEAGDDAGAEHDSGGE